VGFEACGGPDDDSETLGQLLPCRNGVLTMGGRAANPFLFSSCATASRGAFSHVYVDALTQQFGLSIQPQGLRS
jgi:hypothetical protein